MQVVSTPICRAQLWEIAQKSFGSLIKVVVDVRKQIMVMGADLHSDGEALLLSQGSNQSDLWGINLYPELTGDDFIEFDSMINLRPNQGNPSRNVESLQIRQQIRAVVNRLIQ